MNKIFCSLFFLVNSGYSIFGQGGVWTWVKGDSVFNTPANFGVQGVADAANNPPPVYEAANWTDLQGNFWIFGGLDTTESVTGDLWRYTPLNNEWTWMKGPGLPGQYGIYGTQGVPSPANNPGSRSYGTLSWTDKNGNLWLFGGTGSGASSLGPLNDLWMYNINTNEWTWMKGTDSANAAEVYGVMQQASQTNRPGGRFETNSAWTDDENDLWFFGGKVDGYVVYNDMWKYAVNTNEWTWMKGYPGATTQYSYGQKGVENVTNLPPPRFTYTRWKDAGGNFYIYGGATFSDDLAVTYGDVWRFNIADNNWTWMAGDSGVNGTGNYDQYCEGGGVNLPAARLENRTAQVLGCSNFFYSFGGCLQSNESTNDLWLFNSLQSNWVWLSGSNGHFSTGSYGIQGVPSNSNQPAARRGHCLWVDQSGVLWMYGGSYDLFEDYTDMWKFVPDTSCFHAPILASSGIYTQLSSSGICPGDTAELTLGGVINSVISPTTGTTWLDSFHILIYPDTTITYLITGESACHTNDSAFVKIYVLNQAFPLIASASTICSNDSALLCAPSGLTSYLWNTGQTGNCIYANEAGTYSVTVTDSNTCTASSNNFIISVNSAPVVSISVNGDTLTAYNAQYYQWYRNDSLILNATQDIFIADQGGSYTVTLKDSNGCEATSSPIIISGLNDLSAPVVEVYPNPLISGNWNLLVSTEFLGSKLVIYDANGRIISKDIIQNKQTKLQGTFEAGIYLMQIISPHATIIRKLIRL